ncbi:MAG: vWA domain-containing protein [Caldilineaceae bacterium]
MTKQRRRPLVRRIYWWIGLLAYSLLPFAPLLAQAQPAAGGTLVQSIDCQTTFPTCTVTLFHPQLGPLATNETITISGDGIPLPLTNVETRPQPLQVMFVLDAPAVIRQGNIDKQFVDATRHVLEWFQRDPADPTKADILNSDWWSAYIIGATTESEFTPITPWQQGNYVGFTNQIQTYMDALPRNGPASTALFAPLRNALTAFQDQTAAKVLVLFSDGFDRGQNDLAGVIQTASANHVRIHTVLHWNGGGNAAISNLQTLATETGGQFVNQSAGGDLNTIWQALEQEQHVAVGAFTAPSTFPQQLTVSVQLADGQPLEETVAFPAPTLPPLQLTAITVNGVSDSVIVLPPEATTMEITLGISGPGGGEEINQRVSQVVYNFGEATFVQSEPPFDHYTIALEKLALGESARAHGANDRSLWAGRH